MLALRFGLGLGLAQGALRTFSTSAVAQFPKLKSHSGAKKRWKAVSNGNFKRGHSGHQHLNECKRPSRKNRLAETVYSNKTQRNILKKLILP